MYTKVAFDQSLIHISTVEASTTNLIDYGIISTPIFFIYPLVNSDSNICATKQTDGLATLRNT